RITRQHDRGRPPTCSTTRTAGWHPASLRTGPMKTLLACGLGILLIVGAAPGGEGKDDQAKLKGKWRAELDGKKIDLEFAKDAFTIDLDGMVFKGTFKIDPKKKPKEMDLTITEGDRFQGDTSPAIY